MSGLSLSSPEIVVKLPPVLEARGLVESDVERAPGGVPAVGHSTVRMRQVLYSSGRFAGGPAKCGETPNPCGLPT